MLYVMIDIVYICFVIMIHKLRSSRNQIIRELDNGYAFYASLDQKQKEIYWKKDTQLLVVFLILIGISMNIMFVELYFNVSTVKTVMLFVMNLMISCVIYYCMYRKVKRGL